MNKILNSKESILDDYVGITTDRFYTLKYGIKRCGRILCKDLVKIRYDLLSWYESTDDGISSNDTIVDAGPDQVIQLPATTGNLNGYYTQGTVPIVSQEWTKVSGPSITISDPTLLVTSYTTTSAGIYVLKLTVKDENGKLYSDTMNITVLASLSKVYYGFRNTNVTPIESEILSSPFINISGNPVNYTLPLDINTSANYIWFAEDITEPIKTKWVDINNPLNSGFIGSSTDLFGTPIIVGSKRVYMTQYKTQFSYPVQIKVV